MNQAYIPQRLPEGMTPQQIGAHMAALRAQFNLTQLEVSERLHIRTRYVSAIEEGRIEAMPGKVYARGYIHTYAEFLGLDPEHTVGLFYAGDATAAPTPTLQVAPIARAAAPTYRQPRPWRSYGMMAVGVLVVVLVISQIFGRGDDAVVEEQEVAAVPEAMLQTVRNLMMPTPHNHSCLMVDAALNCFYADEVTQDLADLYAEEDMRFVGELDIAGLTVPLEEKAAQEEAAKAEAEKAAEEAKKEEKKTDEKKSEEDVNAKSAGDE